MGWKDTLKSTTKNVGLEIADTFLDSYERAQKHTDSDVDVSCLREAINSARTNSNRDKDE